MRLLKLSLVFLIFSCVPGLAQDSDSRPVSVPAHPLILLLHRFPTPMPAVPPGGSISYLPDGALKVVMPAWVRPLRSAAQTHPTRSQLSAPQTSAAYEPKLPSATMSMLAPPDGNTCFKLRKYIFHPQGDWTNPGVKPVMPMADSGQLVGETDCTYARKVWPKGADGQPVKPGVGLQSAVARSKR